MLCCRTFRCDPLTLSRDFTYRASHWPRKRPRPPGVATMRLQSRPWSYRVRSDPRRDVNSEPSPCPRAWDRRVRGAEQRDGGRGPRRERRERERERERGRERETLTARNQYCLGSLFSYCSTPARESGQHADHIINFT